MAVTSTAQPLPTGACGRRGLPDLKALAVMMDCYVRGLTTAMFISGSGHSNQPAPGMLSRNPSTLARRDLRSSAVVFAADD